MINDLQRLIEFEQLRDLFRESVAIGNPEQRAAERKRIREAQLAIFAEMPARDREFVLLTEYVAAAEARPQQTGRGLLHIRDGRSVPVTARISDALQVPTLTESYVVGESGSGRVRD